MPLCRYLSPFSSEKDPVEEEECVPIEPYKCPSDLSQIESDKSGFVRVRSRTQLYETAKPPNLDHELNVAKSILQEGSTLTGNSLFDHLADVIKVVMTKRPTNLIDYFEEFSHNLRRQQLRMPNRFPLTRCEPVNVENALNYFHTMKLTREEDKDYDVCQEENAEKSNKTGSAKFQFAERERKLLLNENVHRLHLYWSLCGFGFLTDEVLHLAQAMRRIQFAASIEHARFWGKIYGTRKIYYIVEARLTESEMEIRLEQMKEEMMEKMSLFTKYTPDSMNYEAELELIPGIDWQDKSAEELAKMTPSAAPIPTTKCTYQFDIPPEPIGVGLNRLTYFVVNDLNEQWTELPIVTPKQIAISREIKMYLTGDLEADIVSYPSFPGIEKHYLRAMIARITAGTYVAPERYYRKLTKAERSGEELEAEDELGIEEENGELLSNDAVIIENSEYVSHPRRLMKAKNWVHVRPNILDQGRVVYFDEVAARLALEREARRRLEPEGEIEEELELDDENEEFEDEDKPSPEKGPSLFTSCAQDENGDFFEFWTPKKSSVHNTINRLIMLQSQLWPGAFSFTIYNYSDSIYLGWGCKHTDRNITIPHLPQIQNDFHPDNYEEVLDPTVEMEKTWRLFMNSKEIKIEQYVEEEVEEESEPC